MTYKEEFIKEIDFQFNNLLKFVKDEKERDLFVYEMTIEKDSLQLGVIELDEYKEAVEQLLSDMKSIIEMDKKNGN